jgi:septal ring factor EnvC (AmiA/AmiB activator)
LESARRDRARALAQLQSRITSHGIELKELKSNASALEDLVKRLQTALAEPGGEEFGAVGGHHPFADLRGKLPWPVHGAVAARFGDARAGGLVWNGILLDTHRGAEVRAVAAGRVAYADWLPGLGLLLILDHGGGWMTLYGYNGRLLRNVGDRLRPGDVLAESQTAADAGKPQLYFEIREAARAVDPARFLKGTSPP